MVFGRNPHSRTGERAMSAVTPEGDSARRRHRRMYPTIRSVAVQRAGALWLLIGWLVCSSSASNTQINLARSRNISSGFEFLSKIVRLRHHPVADPLQQQLRSYGRALLVGFLNTLLVSAVSIVCRHASSASSWASCGCRRTGWSPASRTLYIEIFRNVPLLLWIFIFYGAVLKPLPGPSRR